MVSSRTFAPPASQSARRRWCSSMTGLAALSAKTAFKWSESCSSVGRLAPVKSLAAPSWAQAVRMKELPSKE